MTKEELKVLIFSEENKARYQDFTILDNPVPFNEFANDKNIDAVQPHIIVSVPIQGKKFITWAGSFEWKNNEINSLDGDCYNETMNVLAYEWFGNTVKIGLDIIVDNF
jgi:hypothetical protein